MFETVKQIKNTKGKSTLKLLHGSDISISSKITSGKKFCFGIPVLIITLKHVTYNCFSSLHNVHMQFFANINGI